MRRSALLSLVTTLALGASAGVPASAQGAAGTLDRSFGADGVVGTPNGFGSVITGTPAGGVIVAYNAPYGTGDFPGWVVRRYSADGEPRRAFGNGGKVRIPGGDAEDLNDVKEVRIDDRGRIVLAGWDYDGPGTSSAKVVRLLAGGRRDASFGERGIVLLDVEPGRSEYFAGMVIQPTGRIVLGGVLHRPAATRYGGVPRRPHAGR